jgi:1,3-beta-glucan synthase
MSYPNDGPRPSNYSTNSGDPFNPQHGGYEGGPPPPGGPLPPGAAQPYQYYDGESDMGARYEGGGMGRETWGSESGWSEHAPGYPGSEASHQQGYPSRASTPTYEGSKDGHRAREPYVSITIHPSNMTVGI